MYQEKPHSRGGAEGILGIDGVQHGSSGVSPSTCRGVNGGGCLEVTSYWAGAGLSTPAQSWAATSSVEVKMLIQLQSLLQLFQSPHIREEFCSGKIIIAEDRETILLAMDFIYNLLLPTWSCQSLHPASKVISNAANHFDLLCHRSPELFRIPCGNLVIEEHSYATWMNTFHDVMNSKYWQQPTNQLNTVISNEPKNANICRQANTTTRKESCSEIYSQIKNPPTRAMSIDSTTRNETLKSYCVKLQHAAGVDYQDNQRETVQQLQEHVIATTPKWFGGAIERRKLLRKLLGQEAELTWGQFLEEADRQDKKQRKSLSQETPNRYHQDNPKICKLVGVHERKSPKRHFGTRVFKNSINTIRSCTNGLHCSYCDRDGHKQEDCWRRYHSCLICGNPDHHFKKCAKYSQSYQQIHRVNEVESDHLRPSYVENMFSDSDTGQSEEETDEEEAAVQGQLNDSRNSLGVESCTGFQAGYYQLSPSTAVEPEKTIHFGGCTTSDLDVGHTFAPPLSPIILPDDSELWELSLEDISPLESDGVPVDQWESGALGEGHQPCRLVQPGVLQTSHTLTSPESTPSDRVDQSFNSFAGFGMDQSGWVERQRRGQILDNVIRGSALETLELQGEEELQSSVFGPREGSSLLESSDAFCGDDAGALGSFSSTPVDQARMGSSSDVSGRVFKFCQGRITRSSGPVEEHTNGQSSILEYRKAERKEKLQVDPL